MTDFNALPLAEKIKQAQAGDIVVTDSGARLPFIMCVSVKFIVQVTRSDTYHMNAFDIADIIRPTARKVPEVVELREKILMFENAVPYDFEESIRYAAFLLRRYIEIAHKDHFEKETP